MWNRRDCAVLAAAALATFGLTVGTFWPRVANAVDGQANPTVEVKVPVLEVGDVLVTAALDKKSPHTVLLTAKNLSGEPASAVFQASASSTPETLSISRRAPSSRQGWSSDYALQLQPYENQVVAVDLPDSLFGSTAGAIQVKSVAGNSNVATLTVPGRTSFTLVNPATKQTIVALDIQQAAAPANSQAKVLTLTAAQVRQ
jgi:hypothetical protein